MTVIIRHDTHARPCDVTLSSETRRGVFTRVLGAILSPGVRDRVGIAQNTGRPVPHDFCACRIRWSTPLKFRQEPESGFSNRLKSFRWVLFHEEHNGERTKQSVVRVRQGRGYE